MSCCNVLEQINEEIVIISIASEDLKVICSNLGCHVLSIFAKDKEGNFDDVVLGYDNILTGHTDGCCLGAVVGRVANRIGNGSFTLNGVEYKLAQNNGTNTLHGGLVGFNQKVFDYEILEDGVKFHYTSPDMEEGFPGTLDLCVTYQVKGDTFAITYEAQTDKDTIINFTNHCYYNLSGVASPVYDHFLKIDSSKMNMVDETCLAYGEFLDVAGTPFDFREFHTIGERIHEDNEQLKRANGYDHNFVLDGTEDQIVLKDVASGRVLIISTDMPSVQIYTANYLKNNAPGKYDTLYQDRDAVAIETQFMPNAINIQEDPETILRAGEEFVSKTSYRFTVE